MRGERIKIYPIGGGKKKGVPKKDLAKRKGNEVEKFYQIYYASVRRGEVKGANWARKGGQEH